LFAGSDPLGQAVREEARTYSVVGIVKDLKSGLMMATPAPTMFIPMTAEDLFDGGVRGATVILRGLAGAPATEAAAVEIASIHPNITILDTRAFNRDINQFREVIEVSTLMNGGIAVFGTILSLIGLFAVTIHAVARRRKEIGIRVALGARRDQVLRLVLREGAALVVVGGALGFTGAYALGHAFSSYISAFAEIFAVGIDDPLLTVMLPLG
jgi:putative ABC transport system permease protein